MSRASAVGHSPWWTAKRQEGVMGLLFILPLLVLFCTFSLWPLIRAFLLSFTDYAYLHPERMKVIWFGNYVEAFKDPLVRKSFGNTLYYTLLHMPFSVVYPLFLAVMLDKARKAKGFFRTVLYYYNRISFYGG